MMPIFFLQCYINIILFNFNTNYLSSMFCKINHLRSYKMGHYFEQLDPYDYETIEIVLKVIQNADERNTSIHLNQVCPNTVLLL